MAYGLWPDFEIIISLITIIDSKVFVRQLGLSLFRQLDNWRETKLQVNEVARSFFIRHIEGLLLQSSFHYLADLPTSYSRRLRLYLYL